jgi:hypothetical protein
MKKVDNKELMIVGCFYEISSGIVDFFMEVTEAPDQLHQQAVSKEAPTQVQGTSGQASFGPDCFSLDTSVPSKDAASDEESDETKSVVTNSIDHSDGTGRSEASSNNHSLRINLTTHESASDVSGAGKSGPVFFCLETPRTDVAAN